MLRWLSILVVAVALVAAGCGGGSDEASNESTVTVTETDTTDTDTTTEDTESTDASDDDLGSFNWASEDCQSLVQAYVGLSAAIAAASSGQDVSGDIEKFSEYVDKVPDEIQGDVETIATAYGTYMDEIQDLGYKPGEVPSAEQLQALQKASESLGAPEVQAASDRLSAWTTANCK